MSQVDQEIEQAIRAQARELQNLQAIAEKFCQELAQWGARNQHDPLMQQMVGFANAAGAMSINLAMQANRGADAVLKPLGEQKRIIVGGRN